MARGILRHFRLFGTQEPTRGKGHTYRHRTLLSLEVLEDRSLLSGLTLSPTTLTDATADTAYSATLSATGGSGSDTFAVTTGTLPTGITLSTSGVFSGTADTAGSSTFTVTANDTVDTTLSGTQQYTLTVDPAGSLILNPTLPVATFGSSYTAAVNATGGSGSYTYAVVAGALPSWLTLDPSTGILTGASPSTTGSPFSFTIQATDTANSSLTGSQAYTLSVDLALSPTTLTDATANTAYSTTLSAAGGSGTYTFAVSAGQLPVGLELDPNSGILSGTATTSGTSTFSVTATDTANTSLTGTQQYTLNVDPAAVLSITPTTLVAVTANVPESIAISATGGSGAYTYGVTAGSLPTGMSLVSTTGLLSGTPTTAATFNFTVTATDNADSSLTGSQAYSFTVTPASSLTLNSTLPVATFETSYTASVNATGGSGSYTYGVVAGALPSWLTLDPSTGILTGIPPSTTVSPFSFTIEATDTAISSLTGSQAYTLSVGLALSPTTLTDATANTAYSTTLSAAGGSGTYTFAVTAGALPVGLELDPNSGILSGTATTSGTSTFSVTATDTADTSLTGTQQYTLTVDPAAQLTLTPTTVPVATANTAYTTTIAATGGSGSYSFMVTTGQLPLGLTLDSSSGVVSGTPTTSGAVTFTVTATDTTNGGLAGSQQYTLTVDPAATLIVSPTTIGTITANTPVNTTISATGGSGTYTFTVSSGNLPTGLALNSSTGILSGTATTTGTSTFTVTATDTTDSSLTGSQQYTVTVAAASTLTINPTSIGTTNANVFDSVTISATGGSGNYTFGVTAGNLPAGMTLISTSGVLSGTPTVAGAFNFTVTGTDNASSSLTGSQAYVFTVLPATTLTLNPTLPVATVGNNYSAPVNATGGSGSYTYTVETGTLPSWMTLDSSTGVLTGNPSNTTGSPYSFTIKATDTANASLTGSQAYNLTVGVLANATISGKVFGVDGTTGVAGITVLLTSGNTLTGRVIDASTVTGVNGVYTFTDVLPGTYTVTDSSNLFVNSGGTSISGIVVAAGATSSGHNLVLPGLAPVVVSQAFFFSFGVGIPSVAPGLPSAGSGTGAGFTLNGSTPLPATDSVAPGATSYMDLSANFLDPDTTNTVVTFNTTFGNFQVELFDKAAPQTVANFLDNIEAGQYNDSLFTRQSSLSQTSSQSPIVTPYDVLQGGGFTVNSSGNNVSSITPVSTTFQAINNEYNGALHQDVTGTLAMAQSGSSQNSATNQFFFNLDNSLKAQGGYAVFGQVVNSPSVSGDISGTAALQQFTYQSKTNSYTPQDQSAVNSAFYTLPLANSFTPGSSFPSGATTSDLAQINSITVTTPSKGQLTYSVTSSAPSVVTATMGQNTATSTFSANQLQLVAGSTAGTSTITVTVTDAKGETVQQSFTVTVT